MNSKASGKSCQDTLAGICPTPLIARWQIKFDPQQISLRELLDVFFTTHDPTTRNRQGADVGSQYRSIILY